MSKPAIFQSGNLAGAGRPVFAAPSKVTRAVATWERAYLPGYQLSELEKGLALVMQHPDQASRGYSRAKSARTRLQFEINRLKALPKE